MFFLGLLKITPAHSFTDFEIAKRNSDVIDKESFNYCCINDNGTLKNAAEFDGINRFDARDMVFMYSFIKKQFIF